MLKYRWIALVALYLGSCTTNNVQEDESLRTYFDSAAVTGTFALFDNGTNGFTVYNLKRFRDSAYLPASTFKIANALIGLQTGVIRDENMVIPWDGIKRSEEAWNHDLTMKAAFELSAVNYYQEVARRIGRDTMKKWIDSLAYGNRKVDGPIDSFWLNNTLKITADEELGLVKKLYFDQLPFYKRTQEIVRSVMLREDNANYRLSYKTGLGFAENGHEIGWNVGWIEENRHPYFFVLNLESPDRNVDMKTARLNILKAILTKYGFFQGKK